MMNLLAAVMLPPAEEKPRASNDVHESAWWNGAWWGIVPGVTTHRNPRWGNRVQRRFATLIARPWTAIR